VCVNERTLVPTSFKLPILVGYRVQCVCVNERTLVPISFKLPILVGYRVQCVCVNERTLVPTSILKSLAWSDIGINMSMRGHLRISIKNRRKSISPKTTVKRQILLGTARYFYKFSTYRSLFLQLDIHTRHFLNVFLLIS
jgi:hypothetical protein